MLQRGVERSSQVLQVELLQHELRETRGGIADLEARDTVAQVIIIIVISLKQSLHNAYAWSKKTKIQGVIQHRL